MKIWEKNSKQLFKAILRLKDEKEAKRFFRDLLTENEIIEFSSRWEAAKMLDANVPYTKICKKTGLSSRTVARISKWLNKGMGGYKLMLNELHHGADSSEKRLP